MDTAGDSAQYGTDADAWVDVATGPALLGCFAALVTHASLWDFRAFHGSTDAPVWWEQMLGLDPWADAEALERYNPRACADRWTTPTLILHGEKAEGVPHFLGLEEFVQPLELSQVPGQRGAVVHGGGHAYYVDTPEGQTLGDRYGKPTEYLAKSHINEGSPSTGAYIIVDA